MSYKKQNFTSKIRTVIPHNDAILKYKEAKNLGELAKPFILSILMLFVPFQFWGLLLTVVAKNYWKKNIVFMMKKANIMNEFWNLFWASLKEYS